MKIKYISVAIIKGLLKIYYILGDLVHTVLFHFYRDFFTDEGADIFLDSLYG